jgi:type III pantothenate kinase
VNAVAAQGLEPPPLIIVDFGTATTFDVVGGDGAYEGGVICPGINLSMEALFTAAARLPRIGVEEPPPGQSVIGKSTVHAMQSGVFWGYCGLIDGLAARIRAELGVKAPLIATGGLAPLFERCTDAIDRVEGDLTVKGLIRIHQLNTAR